MTRTVVEQYRREGKSDPRSDIYWPNSSPGEKKDEEIRSQCAGSANNDSFATNEC